MMMTFNVSESDSQLSTIYDCPPPQIVVESRLGYSLCGEDNNGLWMMMSHFTPEIRKDLGVSQLASPHLCLTLPPCKLSDFAQKLSQKQTTYSCVKLVLFLQLPPQSMMIKGWDDVMKMGRCGDLLS